MRHVALAMVAGCSFSAGALPGDKPPSAIRDETATDFAAGTAEDVEIDPLGVLEPSAYIAGGLHARGYLTTPVTQTTKWSDLTDAVLGAQAGERYGAPPSDWSTDRPYGLGLGRADYFTVVYDGEVYLPEGPVELTLDCDDDCFIELDLGSIRPTVRSNSTFVGHQTITLARAAWIPIRGALTEVAGTAHFKLSTVAGNILPEQFRSRVSDAHGAIVTGVPDRVFVAPIAGESIETTLIMRDFAQKAPGYDFPGVYATQYGLRYTGQLRIDESGPHTFSIGVGGETGDYARLMIDGRTVVGRWPGQVDQLSASLGLEPGWHDFLLDYAQSYNAETIVLTMATPTRPATPIPPERLRPVRTGGLLAAYQAPAFSLADAIDAQHPGVTTVPYMLSAPEGAVVDFVDMFFDLTNQTRTDLTVQLQHPAGVDAMPLPATAVYDNGAYDYMPDHTTLAGAPVNAAWEGVFTDNVPGGPVGYVYYPYLIASYHGGSGGPFATHAVYTSAPHPTDDAAAIDAIRVVADLHGATLKIEVRTSEDGAWVETENGAAPAVDAGAIVQYRLTIDCDGWRAPHIDSVEIAFR